MTAARPSPRSSRAIRRPLYVDTSRSLRVKLRSFADTVVRHMAASRRELRDDERENVDRREPGKAVC